jgi:MOSC domain-containing protein YiiM
MMRVVEVRVGLPLPNQHYQDLRAATGGWSNKVNPSAYEKAVVASVKCTTESGLEGNSMGSPNHLAEKWNRAALMVHAGCYDELVRAFPGCADTLIRGGFGENFVVDHPNLHPSVVCIGDVYEIGTAEFTVSGPRAPCPKVNAWHCNTEMRKHCIAQGSAGYFFRVSKGGEVKTGDSIRLLKRINHGFTVQRVLRGLWGPAELREDNEAFYTALTSMTDLIAKEIGDVAKSRLHDMLEKRRAEASIGLWTVDNLQFCASRVVVSVLFCGTALAAASLASRS